MKYKNIIIVIFLLSSLLSSSQNDVSEIEKLASTAQIWGFLKYYHPNVASGEFNWDQQLFDVLQKVEKATTKEDLSIVFSDWIDSLGKVKLCESCTKQKKTYSFDKNFNLLWFNDVNRFSKDLSKKLKNIENNRWHGKQYYVKTAKDAKNIIVQNEEAYENFNWQNKNLRLLALFRYWNTVEYFFPYKYQTNQPWNEALLEILPKFITPKSELGYHLAMLELVTKVDDSHARLNTDMLAIFFGERYVPAKFQIVDDKAIFTGFYNDSLASLNDLRIGDTVTEVNDKPIIDIFNRNKGYIVGSNAKTKIAFAWNKIFNGCTDSVTITYERNGVLDRKQISRYAFEDFKYMRPNPEIWKIIQSDIGYINMSGLERNLVPEVMEGLMQTKGIIFDLRNYPKFTLDLILNYFNRTQQDIAKVLEPNLHYPGKFSFGDPISFNIDRKIKQKYKGKVLLLVNSQTISYAELVAMGLQTIENTITLGSQTCGANGNVSSIGFVGGFKTGISGIGIFYPDGGETQRLGIKIDIIQNQTIEGIQQEKDEVLEKAISVIRSKG